MSKIEVNTVEPQCGTTLTLGASGDTVTLGSGASQSGFGRTGTVDWQTGSIKTSTFTAANGEGYFANTSSGAFNMNLPAGTAGNIVSVVDYTNTFQNNNLTIIPNGSQKIGGQNANAILSTEGQSVTFVYVDDTEGWKNVQDSTSNVIGKSFVAATGGTVTIVCTNFKVHTFTGPGTFCVSNAGNPGGSDTVSYMVVAGGGGSGGSEGGGWGGAAGGGAGGFREGRATTCSYTVSPLNAPAGLPVSVQGYPIVVGAGGTLGPGPGGPTNGQGGSGGVSTFSTITSAGGGGGRGSTPANPTAPGRNGGSGGGGSPGPGPSGTDNGRGLGNQPPVSPPQGNNGETGTGAGAAYAQGGGGGATTAGVTAPGPNNGSNGGAGATTHIPGSPISKAGGGGSGAASGNTAGTGGVGGGANGASGPSAGNAAAANTGGGAGGAAGANTSAVCGATGGSGIVVIRYKFQ